MDALKDTDILHWKHSLSELIEISLAQTTSIWRMYGKRSASSCYYLNTQLSVLFTVSDSWVHAGTQPCSHSHYINIWTSCSQVRLLKSINTKTIWLLSKSVMWPLVCRAAPWLCSRPSCFSIWAVWSQSTLGSSRITQRPSLWLSATWLSCMLSR